MASKQKSRVHTCDSLLHFSSYFNWTGNLGVLM